MLHLADRLVKTVSDLTLGTVIVLVHSALAERTNLRTDDRRRRTLPSAS